MPTLLRDVAARTAVVGLVATLIAVLVLLAWQAVPALLVIFCGVLVALLLGGLAPALARRSGLGYRLALALSGAGVLAFVVGVLWWACSRPVGQPSPPAPHGMPIKRRTNGPVTLTSRTPRTMRMRPGTSRSALRTPPSP
jgi:predicted membrane channel-forming protein YqfA (hemolysin III family)